MISAGDFKNGITLEMDNNIYQIIEFQHVKAGKGAAFVRTKLKNIINGGVIERFQTDRKVPASSHRLGRYAVSVFRRGSVLFHERGDI